MNKEKTKLAAIDLAEIAIFVGLMIVGAFVKIPFPMVPLTFQTVFCSLSGLLIGWKKGSIAMIIYMIMGLVGIPIFTAGGGIAYVVKPSFGYIVGFIFGALLSGLIIGKDKKVSLVRYIVASLSALAIDYLIGILYFVVLWKINNYPNLWSSIVTYNLLYIPKDLVLCILAGLVAWKVAPMIEKIGSNKEVENKKEILEKVESKDEKSE
jgi:biotin transport system substrate-specific component